MKRIVIVIAAFACLHGCGQKPEPHAPNSPAPSSDKGGVDGFLSGTSRSTKIDKPTGAQQGGTEGFLGGGAAGNRFVEPGKKAN